MTSQYLQSQLLAGESLIEISIFISSHRPNLRQSLVDIDQELFELEEDLIFNTQDLHELELNFQQDMTAQQTAYQSGQRALTARILELEEDEADDEEEMQELALVNPENLDPVSLAELRLAVQRTDDRRFFRDGRRRTLEAQLADNRRMFQERMELIRVEFEEVQRPVLQMAIGALENAVREAREVVDGYLRFYRLTVAEDIELVAAVWDRLGWTG